MFTWLIIAVMAWPSFELGSWIAMWLWPRVEGARANPVSASRVGIAFAIIAFLGWNQRAKVLPLTILHAGILAGCTILGYQSARGRQASLQDDINSLSRGVSSACEAPVTVEEQLKALLAVAQQNDVIKWKLHLGIIVEASDGRPTGLVKQSANTLVDDLQFPQAQPTTMQEKVDILLQEIGVALLSKFGEDVIPKHHMANLSPRDMRNLKESNARTRAYLDADSIDWVSVHDAIHHISEARLRRGIAVTELTDLEQRVRSEKRSKV